jgi:hypothetical protein
MKEPIKDYDCVAEVRKIRERINAKYAYDPEAWFKHLDEVYERMLKNYGVKNE